MRTRIALATLGWLLTSVNSAPASPQPEVYQQPDGSETPELFLNGDERYAWLADSKGYTVIQDASGWYVYAQKTAGGDLESAGARVGRMNPKKLGLEPQLIHDHAFADQDGDLEEDHMRRRNLGARNPERNLCKHEATTLNPCYLKQLALLVRFDDHKARELPAPEEIDILFNHNGPTGNPTSTTASTGSIADVYRANSFDTFVLDTHVTPWIQISKPEAYAAQGKNGFNLPETRECWAEALEIYAKTLNGHGLEQFDGDKDGYIDGMAVVHSGAAAENNGPDCETNAIFNNRIWSHAVPKAPNFEFLSEFKKDLGGIKVGRFYVFSGLYDLCPKNGPWTQWDAGRIAVGVHEAGHFLGLPDLYGKPGKDNGIGNFGFMGT
jgi:M6 family metalloprotease-like protein